MFSSKFAALNRCKYNGFRKFHVRKVFLNLRGDGSRHHPGTGEGNWGLEMMQIQYPSMKFFLKVKVKKNKKMLISWFNIESLPSDGFGLKAFLDFKL